MTGAAQVEWPAVEEDRVRRWYWDRAWRRDVTDPEDRLWRAAEVVIELEAAIVRTD